MKNIVALLLILIAMPLSAQMTPEEIVQKQLETYNNRDINGFMSVIDQNITMHDFSTEILTRTVFDNKVIDHEYITGRKGSSTAIELVLIYEVTNEKITKISVLRKEE